MTISQTDKLKVDNSCPFLLARMTTDGQNYFCKSCSKTIVDFREKTSDQLKCSINKDTCGIFTIDQLPGQQNATFFRQAIFYFLTILSFLGVSVKPLNAQTTETKKDTVSVNTKAQSKDTSLTDKSVIKGNAPATESKGLFRKKKKNYRVIGTPSF
jgi:hypothetical protein